MRVNASAPSSLRSCIAYQTMLASILTGKKKAMIIAFFL
jgi:hypothetical protein